MKGWCCCNVWVGYVEQDALMSPNPRGKIEDLDVGCVCVVYLFETC